MMRKTTKTTDVKSNVTKKIFQVPSKPLPKITRTTKTESKIGPVASCPSSLNKREQFESHQMLRCPVKTVTDDNQLSDDDGSKTNKSGDQNHGETSLESLTAYQKLIKNLEMKRLERERLAAYSEELSSKVLSLRAQRSSSDTRKIGGGVQSDTQESQGFCKQLENVMVDGMPFMDALATVLTEIRDGKFPGQEKLRDELEAARAKIAGLEDEKRIFESKCLILESEKADLKSVTDRIAGRLENLEKENADMKFELEDEVRIHSMEIEKLSNQKENALKKVDDLERENSNLKSELADKFDEWTNQIQNAINEKDEAIAFRDEQQDVVTQQLIELQRKDDFITTMNCENENLHRKNKEVERRIGEIQKEYETKFERLNKVFQEMSKSYSELVATREKEMKKSKLNGQENDSVDNVTGRMIEDRLEQRVFAAKDTDKMRTVHSRKTNENVNMLSHEKEEYHRDNNIKRIWRYRNISFSEDEDKDEADDG